MFTDNGKKTIFDDVRAKTIIKATIPEFEIIKPTKTFSVNKDKFDFSLIVDEYKMPTFKYIDDNSLNDFYDFPDLTLSQNPEYKYKYPHLSTGEYIKQQYQTEEGTPNELNTFMRQDATGDSIEYIKDTDNAYQQGLKQIQKMINEDSQKMKDIIKDKTLTDIEKANEINYLRNDKKTKTKQREILKKHNPVIIKKAIVDNNNDFFNAIQDERKQTIKNAFKTTVKKAIPKPQAQPQPKPSTVSSGVQESKTAEPKTLLEDDDKNKKVTIVQSLLRQKNAKKILEEKRKSLESNDDAKTEPPQYSTKEESYKSNIQAISDLLLNKYKHLPDTATIDDFESEDRTKIRGLMKAVGINRNTKSLKTLRNKI